MKLIEFIKGLPYMEDRDTDYVNAPNYYPWLNAMVADYRPQHILEIGVRLGYSAVAMLYENDVERYVGIDNDSLVADGLEKAEANLSHLVWKGRVSLSFDLFNTDTQKPDNTAMEKYLEHEDFDLVHIDGDHSYKGAMRDMQTFWPKVTNGGHMLVDDSIYIPEVRKACEDFAKMTNAPHYNVETFRGTWVFLRE